MTDKLIRPKTWSRKGRCPSCTVSTGSKHRSTCTYDYGGERALLYNPSERWAFHLTHPHKPAAWIEIDGAATQKEAIRKYRREYGKEYGIAAIYKFYS